MQALRSAAAADTVPGAVSFGSKLRAVVNAAFVYGVYAEGARAEIVRAELREQQLLRRFRFGIAGADTAPSLMPVSPKESARDTSAAFDDIAETLDSRSAFPLSSFVWVLTAGVRRAQAAVTDSVSSTQSRKRASSFFIVMTILS